MGGAETWLISLLRYFQEEEERLPFKVTFDILLTGGAQRCWTVQLEILGARLFYIPFTRRKVASFVRDFRAILANGKYDAVHDHQELHRWPALPNGLGHLPPVRIAHVHNPLYHPSELRRWAFDAVRAVARQEVTEQTGNSTLSGRRNRLSKSMDSLGDASAKSPPARPIAVLTW